MKLSARWYPQGLAARAAWHFNFSTQAAASGTSYGLTAAQVAQIAADAAVVEYFNEYDEYLKSQMETWREMRDAYLDGDLGDVAPRPPEFDVPALPADALVAIAERTEKYADKIKASDDYSPSVGDAYGIVSAAPEPPPVGEMKPVAKSYGAIAEFKASFKIALKGMSGVQMQMERDGDPVTHKINFPSGDIIDDTPLLVPAKAETRRYRFYFLQKNTIVGESSELYEVTVHA